MQIIVSENYTQPSSGCSLDSALFEALAIRIPDLVKLNTARGSGRVTRSVSTGIIEASDLRVKRILDALGELGIDIFNCTLPMPFMNLRIREYEESDLDESTYMVIRSNKYIGETTDNNEYDDRGIPFLKAALRPYEREFGTVVGTQGAPLLVVRGEVKSALEKAGLKGMRLVEPIVKGRKELKPEEKVWVIWSDLTLPPMKNLCYDNAGERFRYGDRESFPKGCMIFEGFFSQSEIHYRRKDLERFGEFDIAVTAERFGTNRALQPFVIMSQRFRRFMEDELRLDVTGIPVRVDDDDVIPWGGPYPEPWEHLNKRPEWLKKFALRK